MCPGIFKHQKPFPTFLLFVPCLQYGVTEKKKKEIKTDFKQLFILIQSTALEKD